MKKIKGFSLVLSVIKQKKADLSITFIAAIISSIAMVLATLAISRAVDYMIGIKNVQFQSIYKIALALVIIYISGALCSWVVSAFSNKIAFTVARDLRHIVFDKLGKLPLSFFDRTPHGDIISRFTNDLNSISDALTTGLVSLFTGIVTVITIIIIMFALNIKITILVLIIMPINFLGAWLIAKFSQDTFKKQQEIIGDLSGFVSEYVGNQKTVKVFGYEKTETQSFMGINSTLQKVGIKAQFASAMVNPLTRILDHLTYIIIGFVGALMAIAGSITVGGIAAFLMFSAQLSKPFNEISGIMSNLQTAAASIKRMEELLAKEEEVPDSPDAQKLKNPKGLVEFEDVAFSYDKNRPLIENLNIKAEPGNVIAIVGPTGAGKTTIVNLLMRFYEIDAGSIKIDDKDIINIYKDSLRTSFGMVLQETWLFNGTIRDNIAYGRQHATNEEVVKASKMAYAHNFIKKLPKGYDTIISENSDNISQGQKQLLTIARVMLTNPSMLILDEATSSIDTLTEKRVQRAFLELIKGRTSFVIAHRLSTIVQADSIIVLDKGRVIETGNHETLIKKRGFYYELYQSQFG